MTLSPETLSRECGLNILLPVGRLNGLYNMVALIQKQVSCEIERLKSQNVNDQSKITESSDGSVLKSDKILDESRDTSDEVAVLLSGGVDSSVALKLLQLQVRPVSRTLPVENNSETPLRNSFSHLLALMCVRIIFCRVIN